MEGIKIIFGNSQTGEVDTEYASSVQVTYAVIRDDEDHEIASFQSGGLWRRRDGTLWTDINFEGTDGRPAP